MPPPDSNSTDDSDSSERVERRYGDGTPPSIAIVGAIAAIENVDPMDSPTELGITLSDHIDPTALDRLVTRTNGGRPVIVDLTIRSDHRYSIQVRDTGQVVVEKVAEDEM